MDDKATLNGSSRSATAAHLLADRLVAMSRDVAKIAELQAQLFAADLSDARREVLQGLTAALLGCLLVGTALPVALIGLGLWLAEATELSAAGGLLVVAAGGAALAALAFGFGWRQFRDQRGRFTRSRQELTENMRSLSRALSRHADDDAAD